MIIETEANGKWKTDTFYQIDYIISLTYLNENIIDKQSLRLLFYNPMVIVNDWIFGTGDYQFIKNETSVFMGYDGTQTLKINVKGGERIQLKAMLNYQVLKDNQEWYSHGEWRSQEPIWIDIEKEIVPSPDYTIPLIVAIGAIASISIGTYFIHKTKRKTKYPLDPIPPSTVIF
jgi:hypothetical protein